MRALAAFVRFAEAINGAVGRVVSWLSLATVLICATVVIIRYAFQSGFIWMQELYVWTHGAAFMLGAGYAFLAGRHVRVDILYARWSDKKRAWFDLFSTVVFLFPWLGIIGYYAWPYVISSWRWNETSHQVGGMPGLYILKTAILGFCGLMLLQGLANCARNLLTIAGADHLAPKPQIAGLGE